MYTIAIDTETHLFSDGNRSPKIICLTFFKETGESGLLRVNEVGDILQDWLKSDEIRLVGQNVEYDMRCLISTFPKLKLDIFNAYKKGKIACTKIRERLLDIADDKLTRKGYSLQDLYKKYFNKHVEKTDTWRLKYAQIGNLPTDQWPKSAVEYAINDAKYALDIWKCQEIRKKELCYNIPTEQLDTYASFCLGLMSSWGIKVDQEYTKKRWTEEVTKLNQLAEILSPSGIMTVKKPQLSLFSNNSLEIFKTKKNLKLIRELIKKSYRGNIPKTDKGSIKTSAEVIEKCDHPLLNQLNEFNKIEKNVSTFLSKLIDKSIVHPEYHAVGGVSDRTSCSNPNVQQLPRDPGFRECFVPRKGHVLLTSDFDSQEMRTLGQACLDIVGYSKLAREYQKNRKFDPHTEFAKMMFKTNSPTRNQRQQTKVANFGFPGGLKARSFVKFAKNWGLETTEKQGQTLLDMWFEQWPEMHEYFRHVQDVIGGADYGTQVIPQSGFVRKGVGYNDCANGYFQTLAGHSSKEALCAITEKCFCDRNSILFNSRTILFIHDELGLETPKPIAEETGIELSRIMIESMEVWTKDVPSEASYKIMDRWTKQ